MSETKHTPEPWYTRHGQISSETSMHGCTIANCNSTARGISDEEAKANAARIVACVNGCKGINPDAVPDLLHACEVALAAMETGPGTAEEAAIIRAALAKANGRDVAERYTTESEARR